MLGVIVIVVGTKLEVIKIIDGSRVGALGRLLFKSSEILLGEPSTCALAPAVGRALALSNRSWKQHSLRGIRVGRARVTLRAVNDVEVRG